MVLSQCWTLRRKRTGAGKLAPDFNMAKKKKGNVLVRNIYATAISTGYSKIPPGECAEVDANLADQFLDAGMVEIMDLDVTTGPIISDPAPDLDVTETAELEDDRDNAESE